MKKFLSLTIALLMLLSLMVSAFAETTEAKLEIIGIDEMLKDKSAWVDKAEALSVTDKKLERENAKGYKIFNYTGKEYLNEIFEFDLTLNDLKPGDTWNSVILRASKDNQYKNIWSDNVHSYCFNIRTNSVEVQRYHKGRALAIGIYPCEIKSGEKFTVRAGAINVSGGVQLIFYINGKQIVNVFDNNEKSGGYITEGGYFGLCNYSKMVVEPASKKYEAIKGIPVALGASDYSPKASTLKADYKILGDTEVETAWYECASNYEWILKSPDLIAPEELKKIEGSENKNEYTLTQNDIGKYILFGITDKQGNLSLTRSVYIDPVAHLLSESIYMVYGNSLACVKGEKVNVDENDAVTPEIIDAVSYVPLRFLVEKSGGTVSWNEEKRSVEIKIGDYVSLINIGDTNVTVNEKAFALKKAPYINNERTMICIDDVILLTGLYAKNFHDCIVSVTKEDIELSVSEVAQIETHIIK